MPTKAAAPAGISLPDLLPAGVLADGARRREALRALLDHIDTPSDDIDVLQQRWRAIAGEEAPGVPHMPSLPVVVDDTALHLTADRSGSDLWVLHASGSGKTASMIVADMTSTARRRVPPAERKTRPPAAGQAGSSGSGQAGELRPVVAAEPGIAGATAGAVLNRLVADSLLAGWLEVLAQRLHTNVAELLISLDLIADSLPAGADDPAAGLTEAEEAALRAAGSLREPMPEPAERASVRTAVKDAAIRSSALTVRQAAKQLGVTDGRIRQRLTARTLYGMLVDGAWRLPRWQFGEDGKPIRGLEKVLPRLPEEMHPVAVHAWLTTAKSDLELDGTPISPAQWLAGGGKVDEVIALVADLDWSA